jgi:hypothetical protein
MRWSTSGRFTPAAATWMTISPGPGFGTGRVQGTSTSGPPGALMHMAVMVSGRMEVMRRSFRTRKGQMHGNPWQG